MTCRMLRSVRCEEEVDLCELCRKLASLSRTLDTFLA
jgi:hypothetical protein